MTDLMAARSQMAMSLGADGPECGSECKKKSQRSRTRTPAH